MRQHLWRAILVPGLIIVGFGGGLGLPAGPHGPVSAQSRAATPDQDVLPALLTEVRGLRAAMEQMASAGPQVQLAIGRLQLQEQRVNTLLRRLDDVRANVSRIEGEVEQQRQRQGSLEQALQSADEKPGKPGRLEIEDQLKATRTEIARGEADLLRFQAEEGTTTQQVALEQGRWTDINQRLDELEKALTRR